MRHFLLFLSFVFVFATGHALAASTDETSLKNAQAYIDKVAGQALETIKSARADKITQEEAKKQFRVILNNAFDLDTIARFTLGRYWRIASPAEQRNFTGLLQRVILNKYADRLLEFSGDKYTVDKARTLNARDIVVNSTIYPNDKPPVAFDWRLRRVGSSYKVIDLAVEGISMSVTHRSDFASVIESKGGKVQSLIDALQDKEDNQK
jgi:phospholipid transport system substrate-binding protein